MPSPVEEYLTPSQAAVLLGVSIDTVRIWADSAQIPCHRTLGNHRRFKRSDVEAARNFGASKPDTAA